MRSNDTLASAYMPASNCARASASSTDRDSGTAALARLSSSTAACRSPFSSRTTPRWNESYTSPEGSVSGGGGGRSANGGRAGGCSSSSSFQLWSVMSPPFGVRRCRPSRSGLASTWPRTMRGMTSQAGAAVPTPSGLELVPFRALRYDESVAGPLGSLTSPPYDVIDEDGVRRFEAMSPYNVVRVILPREPDSGTGTRYDAAAALLARWRDEGVLRPDGEPALYAYEMRDGDTVTRGLLGALALVDP